MWEQRIREFRAPAEPLEKTLESYRPKRRVGQPVHHGTGTEEGAVGGVEEGNSTFYLTHEEIAEGISSPSTGTDSILSVVKEKCL